MTRFADMFGHDDADWMSNPHRLCIQPDNNPAEIQYYADSWFTPAADLVGKPAVRRPDGWAKKLCAGCPVQTECLTHALENNEQWGVWGGTTAVERAKLKKKDAA